MTLHSTWLMLVSVFQVQATVESAVAGLAGVFRDMGVAQTDKDVYEDATVSLDHGQRTQLGNKNTHAPYSTMRPSREVRDVLDGREYVSLGAHFTSTFPRSGSRLALKQMAAQKQEEQDERDREEDAERDRNRDKDFIERVESHSDTYSFLNTPPDRTNTNSCELEGPRSNSSYQSPPDSPNYRDLEDSLNGTQQASQSSSQLMKYERKYNENHPKGLFSTPILPAGKCLKIEILSTWGDDLYVGLNGLDIFDVDGNLLSNTYNRDSQSFIRSVTRENKKCEMDASQEYKNDPRDVTNLVNGTNFTRDDLHVWLAPLGSLRDKDAQNCKDGGNMKNDTNNERCNEFRKYEDDTKSTNSNEVGSAYELITTISINFTHSVVISLIRVFNYNKSRTHCTRGVKDCILKLDDVIIYKGYALHTSKAQMNMIITLNSMISMYAMSCIFSFVYYLTYTSSV